MNLDEITKHEFFSSLDDRVLSVLAQNAGEASFPAGEYLFQQNELADRFFLIRSGDIEVGHRVNQNLTRQRVLQAGDIVGWSWLIPPYTWTTTAIARSETRVYTFDGIELLVECEVDPLIGYALFKRFAGMMGHRLASLHDAGVGDERQFTMAQIFDSITRTERDPRDRKRFLAI